MELSPLGPIYRIGSVAEFSAGEVDPVGLSALVSKNMNIRTDPRKNLPAASTSARYRRKTVPNPIVFLTVSS